MNTFASSTPDTDSDSSVIAVMSDRDSWVCPAILRRTRPTRIWSRTNSGTSATATTVSCQDSSTIAISAAATVTTLPSIELAVSLSTDCTPPTSLASRDWIAPVRVAVKNDRSIRCRCSNRRPRRSAMTRLPSRVVR